MKQLVIFMIGVAVFVIVARINKVETKTNKDEK